jgi:hypothetical protein
MSLEDALKQLLAIVVDFGLESVRNVVDALFDVVSYLVDAAIDLLDTPIHIPVLSDILKEFEIPEFSLLDIACWIAAVPTNLLYKVIHGATPFPDDEYTRFLITTTDYATLSAAFQASTPRPLHAGPPPARRPMMARETARPPMAGSVASGGVIAMPPDVRRAVLAVCLAAAGACSIVSAVVSGYEAAAPSADNPLAAPSAVLGILGGLLPAVAGVLVPHEPVDNVPVKYLSYVSTAIRVYLLAAFSGVAARFWLSDTSFKQPIRIGSYTARDYRSLGAIVDAVLVAPALFVSIWHFVELAQKPAAIPRSLAIVYEVSNLTSYISRVSYAVAVNTQGLPKLAAAAVVGIANLCCGGLLIGEAVASVNWRFHDEG